MAGKGPRPKTTRRRRNTPARGDWKAPDGIGWQHGKIPEPPDGLLKASIATWRTWFGSWFAAHWTPEDVPGLTIVILLWDQVNRGEYQRSAELRLQMDGYGITPKGQTDRRWEKPAPSAPEKKPSGSSADRRRRLRVV